MKSGLKTALSAVAFLSSAGNASSPVAQFEMQGRVTYVSELPGFECGFLMFWGKMTLSDSKGEAHDAYILCMGEGTEAVPRLGQDCVARYHIGDVHGSIGMTGEPTPVVGARIVDTISCRG